MAAFCGHYFFWQLYENRNYRLLYIGNSNRTFGSCSDKLVKLRETHTHISLIPRPFPILQFLIFVFVHATHLKNRDWPGDEAKLTHMVQLLASQVVCWPASVPAQPPRWMLSVSSRPTVPSLGTRAQVVSAGWEGCSPLRSGSEAWPSCSVAVVGCRRS